MSQVSSQTTELSSIALGVRCLSMDAVLKAKSGHIGLPLGGAEIGTLLYFSAMNHSPQNPSWLDRDRFVLSAGHGSMLQYSLLHLAGYNVSLDEIKNFRQLGSKTPGHPENGVTEGIECTTGPLGQGISNAVGMALAEQMLAARINCDKYKLVDHHTYTLVGDGCLMEGVSSEACSLAGHLKLNKLIAIYDANNITIDGTVDISFTENVATRFKGYGWEVLEASGNDFASLESALDKAHSYAQNKNAGPTLIVAKGIPGKGSPKWEGKHKIHGNPMSAEDVVDAKKHLGLQNTEPFFVPQECYKASGIQMEKRVQKYKIWQQLLSKAKEDWKKFAPQKLKLWEAWENGSSGIELSEEDWKLAKGKMATRVASGKALQALANKDESYVGGSADLAGSNNTTLANTTFVSPTEFSGRNIHFGVREHGMAAICNGMALHGGLRPYCATFAVFSDYMRPSIRLAALSKTPTMFILTHDSYGVGEDGPTHQPVEHAWSLRLIPNLNVVRPADALETFAAWESSSEESKTPTALLLTRQDVPDLDEEGAIRTRQQVKESMRTGAYMLKDFSPKGLQRLTLVSSGSEVHGTFRAAKILEESSFQNLNGESVTISVRVISSPAPQKLSRNPLTLNSLIPENIPTVAVEAGCPDGWGSIVGRRGAICAMNSFGESAPIDKLSDHFGFTPEKIAEFCLNYLKLRKSV